MYLWVVALGLRKASRSDRICFIETELNIGGAGARNMGLNMAKDEYISFLDDDDIWNHDKTKIQLDFLQKNPHQKLVYCNFNQLFQNEKKNNFKFINFF
jgi:GT2 family glycosyltransferase